MTKLFHKNPIFKFLAGLLIAATLQFFVPLLNAAVSDKCCESQQMQCCQEEFPSRMVCCIAEADRGLDDSAPTQGLVHKTQKSLEVTILCQPPNVLNSSLPFFGGFEYFPHSEFTLTNNHLYLRLSTFII